jgi:hypothetical protein
MWKVSGAMKRLSFSVVSLGLAAALAAMLAPGCTTHGEGGRCDPKNLNTTTGAFADCDNGLQCTSGTLLSLPEGGTVDGFICCPQDRSTSTTDICRGSPVSPGSDASISDATTDQSTSDVVTSDVVTSDVSNDVQTDAPITDASTDAPDGD